MKFEWKALPVLALATLIPGLASAQYVRTDLVTNTGAGSTVQDSHLVNAWGLVSTAGSPYWVSDNGTGFSTLYAISNNPGGTVTATPAANESSRRSQPPPATCAALLMRATI